jgi:hypothetical protein
MTAPGPAGLGGAGELDQVVALVAGDAVAVQQRGQLDRLRAGPAGLQIADFGSGAGEHLGGLVPGQIRINVVP